ncbi:hypothetical protein T492DRAFT_885075, partial [Pavlovales sp. CCMP2436]
VRKLGDASNFEKLFVVRLHSASLLAPPAPLFTFEHPNPGNESRSNAPLL